MNRYNSTMDQMAATALAHPNIALIKYWGNRDDDLRLPENGSISMNLASLGTKTSVEFDGSLAGDVLLINSTNVKGEALSRMSRFLDRVREMSRIFMPARVISEINFPIGAGIASSAAAYAALALAGSRAAGLNLSEQELSILARHGSGSACRSIPTGYVEWMHGDGDASSFAHSIAAPEHWNLVDIIAVVDQSKKKHGSSEGHRFARTSPFQAARVSTAAQRLDICRRAILEKDFLSLAGIVELDCNMMHAVMMTSSPQLYYYSPASLLIMQKALEWRFQGMDVCFTLDAGPNVHLLCPKKCEKSIIDLCKSINQISSIIISPVGGGATLVDTTGDAK